MRALALALVTILGCRRVAATFACKLEGGDYVLSGWKLHVVSRFGQVVDATNDTDSWCCIDSDTQARRSGRCWDLLPWRGID